MRIIVFFLKISCLKNKNLFSDLISFYIKNFPDEFIDFFKSVNLNNLWLVKNNSVCSTLLQLLNLLVTKNQIQFLNTFLFINTHFHDDLQEFFESIDTYNLTFSIEEKFYFKFVSILRKKDETLFKEFNLFLLSQKDDLRNIMPSWVVSIFEQEKSPSAMLQIAIEEFDSIPLDVCCSIYYRALGLIFFSGSINQESNLANVLYKKIFDRAGSINIQNLVTKTPSKFFIFADTILSGTNHAPTLIIQKWIDFISKNGCEINLILSASQDYCLPSLLLEKKNIKLPENLPDNVRVFQISNLVEADDFLKAFGGKITEQDNFLSIGHNNLLFDRLDSKRKFLLPCLACLLAHNSNYIFCAGSSTQHFLPYNLSGKKVGFIELSGLSFLPLKSEKLTLPSERHSSFLDTKKLSIVVIGTRLSYEIDDAFYDVLKTIAKEFKMSVTFVGDPSLTIPKIKEIDLKVESYQKDLEGYLRRSNFDFYINPFRNGGGFSAFYALYSGIPVLTLAKGDVFYIMNNYYYMSEKNDFLSFISKYFNDESFREVINGIHSQMKSDFNKSNHLKWDVFDV